MPESCAEAQVPVIDKLSAMKRESSAKVASLGCDEDDHHHDAVLCYSGALHWPKVKQAESPDLLISCGKRRLCQDVPIPATVLAQA